MWAITRKIDISRSVIHHLKSLLAALIRDYIWFGRFGGLPLSGLKPARFSIAADQAPDDIQAVDIKWFLSTNDSAFEFSFWINMIFLKEICDGNVSLRFMFRQPGKLALLKIFTAMVGFIKYSTTSILWQGRPTVGYPIAAFTLKHFSYFL
jgi:hypothetical protein